MHLSCPSLELRGISFIFKRFGRWGDEGDQYQSHSDKKVGVTQHKLWTTGEKDSAFKWSNAMLARVIQRKTSSLVGELEKAKSNPNKLML